MRVQSDPWKASTGNQVIFVPCPCGGLVPNRSHGRVYACSSDRPVLVLVHRTTCNKYPLNHRRIRRWHPPKRHLVHLQRLPLARLLPRPKCLSTETHSVGRISPQSLSGELSIGVAAFVPCSFTKCNPQALGYQSAVPCGLAKGRGRHTPSN